MKVFTLFSFIVLLHNILEISTNKVVPIEKGHIPEISTNNKEVTLEKGHTSGTSPKVAIIGKGLGAALCSYYLHQLIPNVQIDIYDHKSEYKPLLRSFIHFTNLNMIEIVNEKEIKIYGDYRRPWVKDGDKIHHFEIKELAKIDPAGYLRLQEFVQQKFQNFKKIYEFQNDGKSFKTIKELLNNLDPDFLAYYTQETISSLLNKIMAPEASPAIKKFVKSGLLGNCLADMNINGFAGLETLMISEITGRIVQHDPDEKPILKKLIHKKDNILKKDILKIIHSKEDHINYIVSTDNRPIEYDFIILATVTADKIKFEGFNEPVNVFKYIDVNVTYVTGDLVEIYKKISDRSNLILNLDKNQTFNKNLGEGKYGIAKGSVEPSNSEILEYVNPYTIHSYGVFKSCPDYSKDKKSILNSKFELGEKLYNVLAIDPLSMTTSEMLAISAKNIAFLIVEKVSENNIAPKTSGDSKSHVPPSGPNLSKKNPKNRRISRKKKSTHKI